MLLIGLGLYFSTGIVLAWVTWFLVRKPSLHPIAETLALILLWPLLLICAIYSAWRDSAC
jgi:hypothetical protein